MEILVARHGERFVVSGPDGDLVLDQDAFAEHVARLERSDSPRWVWADTRTTYAVLLAAGATVERGTDLRLCHRILRDARATAGSDLAQAEPDDWDAPIDDTERVPSLLDELESTEPGIDDVQAEHARQQESVAGAEQPAPLQLLLHAESAGALIAAEMRHSGLPWSAEIHDEQLVEALGPRPPAGQRPEVLEALAADIRIALDAPDLNPDSPEQLLRALTMAGTGVRSTRKWEIDTLDHPVRAPLLEYKRLSRLHTANGWAWLDTWISNGRFHPDYVPGGVVTGRWATRGGGALQLPKALRRAVVADPGWVLVVADAAQLEPRVLAAMAGDTAMARAGRGTDLYQGLVDQGVVATRQQAKIGMLGAMYGGTTGESGEVLPRLRRAFGRAVGLVDEAARAGERFDQVTTWLGRTSPRPGASWQVAQQRALEFDADEAAERRARSQARDWGRFTRNFVVQGTAAEWALCWMATLRRRLRRMDDSGRRPQLVYFLHDEVIVHAPEHLAADVADALRDAADEAKRLLFGAFDIEFPLTITTGPTYA